MNHKLYKQILDHAPELQGSRLAMMLVLAYMANSAGDCWPRVKTLSAYCHLTDKQGSRLLQDLKRRGYVRELAPRRRGWPPILRVTPFPVQLPDIPAPQGDIQGQPSPLDVPSHRTSPRTPHARSRIELKEQDTLTGDRTNKNQVRHLKRCKHEGCIFLTTETYCEKHQSTE